MVELWPLSDPFSLLQALSLVLLITVIVFSRIVRLAIRYDLQKRI